MDDQPMWVADRVVALTPGFAITLPATANEYAIKDTENEVVRLMMFPLSLTGEAKTWLDELSEGTIKNWNELRTAFISQFFPPALFDRLLGEIRSFSQHEGETLTDAWLRMKEMLKNCHGHNLSKGGIIKIFYHGLNETTQESLNAAAGGPSKTDTERIMARMDAMTTKMDAQYKEIQSQSKQSNPKENNDDLPISRQKEANLCKPSVRHIFTMITAIVTLIVIIGVQANGMITTETLIDLTPMINPGMPDYGKFLKDLISNKNKIEQISAAFLSDKSSAMIQKKVPLKLRDPGSFLIPYNFNKAFSCNALADLGASINLMPYSLYAKLSLGTLKPTKMRVKLADRSFQYPVGIAKNMLIKVGKFTFPVDFVILEMEEDSKIPLILGRPFLHTTDAVIRVKQKQHTLRVGTERIIFNISSAIKHSYSNDDTCFSINVIDEILEEDFDALLDEGSQILHSIEGTILEEKVFAEFDEFIAMATDENSRNETEEEPKFEKIIINTDYKIKTSLEEPPTDLELKPLPDNLEYVFLEEPSLFLIIISSQLSANNKDKQTYNPFKEAKHLASRRNTDIYLWHLSIIL
ncbi:reverse transcriptase domain-containing protein [Tanacetum coccineum]